MTFLTDITTQLEKNFHTLININYYLASLFANDMEGAYVPSCNLEELGVYEENFFPPLLLALGFSGMPPCGITETIGVAPCWGW